MKKEINLERLFKIIKSRIIIIMIASIVSAVAIGLYTKLTVTPKYASAVKFCLVANIETMQNNSAANERNSYMYANELMETCIEAICTNDAIYEMNSFLREKAEYENVYLTGKNIDIEQSSETSNIFSVTIETTDAELSHNACEAFAKMAGERAKKVGSLRLETVDTSKVADKPVSSGTVRNAVVAFIGAFIITTMIFVIISVSDNTVKDSIAICEEFDMLLLAEIPNINQAADRDKAYEYSIRSHSKGNRGARNGR